MACCVVTAALLGGVVGLKSLFTVFSRRPAPAQDWRLFDQKERHEQR